MRLTRNQKIAFWTILFLQLCLLLIFVFFRLIDYDEASYISAGFMVANGRLPYVDFFYAQMPYLPYLFATLSGHGFSSLFLCRLISALAGLVLGVLLFRAAYEFSGNPQASLIVFFLYSFNGLLLTWHSTAKTLVVSDLFGFLSFIFLVRYLAGDNRKQITAILLSGVFIGLAINFRLTFSIIWLASTVLIFLCYSNRNIKKRITGFFIFCLGTALSSLLGIYLFFKNPGAFVFDNITYHQILGLGLIRMGLVNRVLTVCKFFFYPQNLFIILLATVGLVIAIKKLKDSSGPAGINRATVTAFVFAIGLVLISFFISPTTFQHYEQTLPYLLISSVSGLGLLIAKWSRIVRWVTSGLYILFIIPFVVIFLFAIRERDKPYPISEVHRVVKIVEQNSEPGQMVFSTWPGYVIFAERNPLPGLETWGWEVAPILSPQQLRISKLISREKMGEFISEKKAVLMVDWQWLCSEFADVLEPNYHHLRSVGSIDIYRMK